MSTPLRYLVVFLLALAGRGFSRDCIDFPRNTITYVPITESNGCYQNTHHPSGQLSYGPVSTTSDGLCNTVSISLQSYRPPNGFVTVESWYVTICYRAPCNLTPQQCEATSCSWPYVVNVDQDLCLCKIDFSKYQSLSNLSQGCRAFCNSVYNYSSSKFPPGTFAPISSVNERTNLDITKGSLSCVCNLVNGVTTSKGMASCDYDKTCTNEPQKCYGSGSNDPVNTGRNPDGTSPSNTSTESNQTTTTTNSDGSKTTTSTSTSSNGSTTTTTTTTSADGSSTSSSTTTTTPGGGSGTGSNGGPGGPGGPGSSNGPDYTGILRDINNGVQMTVFELQRLNQKLGVDSGSGDVYNDSAVVRQFKILNKNVDSAYFGSYSSDTASTGVDSSLGNLDSSSSIESAKQEAQAKIDETTTRFDSWFIPFKNSLINSLPDAGSCLPDFNMTINFPSLLGGPILIDLSASFEYLGYARALLDFFASAILFMWVFNSSRSIISDLRTNQ